MGVYVVIVVVIITTTFAQAWRNTMDARVQIAKAKEQTARHKLMTARIDAAVREVDISEIV